MREAPNERRNFVHRRLIGAAKGFVTSGFNPLSAAAAFLAPVRGTSRAARPLISSRGGGGVPQVFSRAMAEQTRLHPDQGGTPSGIVRIASGAMVRAARHWFLPAASAAAPAPMRVAIPVRRPAPRTLTARPDATSAGEKAAGRVAKFSAGDVVTVAEQVFGRGRGDDCLVPGMRRDEVDGRCKFALGEQVGRDDTPIGDTVMGRYGAGEMPGNMVVNRAVCRPGMVLGDDGVCYNRTQISNKEREWPRGRRPLLTGGDMRALATAARAGKRLEGATKRLQKLGLMKKPVRRPTAASVHHAK